MAQYIQDAEERRRVSMALSMRNEATAKFAELRHEIWNMLLKVIYMPARLAFRTHWIVAMFLVGMGILLRFGN